MWLDHAWGTGLIGLASGDWFEFRWPPNLTMPGAGAVPAIYLLAIVAFALSTALPPVRQLSTVLYFNALLRTNPTADLFARWRGVSRAT